MLLIVKYLTNGIPLLQQTLMAGPWISLSRRKKGWYYSTRAWRPKYCWKLWPGRAGISTSGNAGFTGTA